MSVTLVRLAQAGNVLAKVELVALVRHTIDSWLDDHWYLARWRGHEDKLREHLEGCIRRYRYSGSFFRYVFRTLEYAGRGLRSLCSLDEPIAAGARVRKIDSVIHDPETNEIVPFIPTRGWSFDSDSQAES